MYDPMYGNLTSYGDIQHYNLVLSARKGGTYTIYIDRFSKCLLQQGSCRWSHGAPVPLSGKMKAILHIFGAWARWRTKSRAHYLITGAAITPHSWSIFKAEIEERLRRIYEGFVELKERRSSVMLCTRSKLSIHNKIDLVEKQTPEGKKWHRQSDGFLYVTAYVLKCRPRGCSFLGIWR